MGTTSCWLSSLCILLVLVHGSMGQRGFSSAAGCRLERLNAQEPKSREESEGGFTEYFDQNNQQFQCAGVAAHRRTIRPQSQLLPSYSNAPRLVFFQQGQAVCGVMIPGCPETFQSFQQQSPRGSQQQQGSHESQSRRSGDDQHQKIQRLREGDVMALPAGVSYWCYNDGQSPLVAFTVMDTGNIANQLGPNRREFLLAGSRKSRSQQGHEQQTRRGEKEQEESSEETGSNNILQGLDTQLLADTFGVSTEVARKLQASQNKGRIVKVERPLQMVQPAEQTREEEEEREREREQEEREHDNGIEQSFCNYRFRQNVDRPDRADVFNPQGGRLTTLNSLKLPILQFIQMSAVRGSLHRGAIVAPQWDSSAHTVLYATKGRARVQIVGDQGKSVFDEELRQGQLVVVPQNFVVVKQARSERFEWISFKTTANPTENQIAGKESIFSAMPIDVISSSYSRISREEARMLKENNKDKFVIVTPTSQQARTGRKELSGRMSEVFGLL